MTAFLIALAALVGGYFVYGRLVEKFFQPTDNPPPAITKNDGVDFMPLPTWKVFMIQLLNIAGLGPIFGALGGAVWGTSVYLWIVLGTIFAGAVHDFSSGLISMREDGKGLPDIIGEYLGDKALLFMRVLSVVLLILVAAVFTVGPAGLIKILTGGNIQILVAGILVYYFLATLLPIDAIIGKFYPVFGVCLVFMAVAIMGDMLLNHGAEMPEFVLGNLHPKGNAMPIWPLMFVTVACGAISGFHATQSPLMARCLKSERLARPVFYGAMVAEGVIALIWAAAGITYFHDVNGLAAALSGLGAGSVVNTISVGSMGMALGATIAMLGVIVCPITSGDTALRSARLIIADWFKIDQVSMSKRLLIAVPMILISGILTQVNFDVIWRYFAWTNQTLATITLWAASVYMIQNHEGKAYLVTLIPAAFMSVVVTTYIFYAPEGFRLDLAISSAAGAVAAALCLFRFWQTQKTDGLKSVRI